MLGEPLTTSDPTKIGSKDWINLLDQTKREQRLSYIITALYQAKIRILQYGSVSLLDHTKNTI
jgi:hypothetical protein